MSRFYDFPLVEVYKNKHHAEFHRMQGHNFFPVVALAIREFEHSFPKLTSRERRRINYWTRIIHGSVTRGTIYVVDLQR